LSYEYASHQKAEREVHRKAYVESLLSRTPEQIAEEESLFIEIKRLEQTERRFAKDRDHLLRTLLGIDSGLPLRMDDDGPIAAQLVMDKKKGKRKVDGIEIDPSFTNSSLASSTPSLRKSTLVKSNAHGEITHKGIAGF
jgi:DNA methyltransferase 1-associated protein 1